MQKNLVEQKISQQVTITAGTSSVVTFTIPNTAKAMLKGYGYTWFTGCTFQLRVGSMVFPKRTDQEGSSSAPVMYGEPYNVTSGNIEVEIWNNDSADHTFDVVAFILCDRIINIESAGGEIIYPSGAGGVSGASVIYNSSLTTSANVTADGLEVHIDKQLPAGTNNIGDVDVLTMPVPSSPATLLCGTKSTSGASAVAIASSTACKKVTIQVAITSDPIYIGNATTQNFRLETGQAMDIEVDNLSKIYIKRSGATDVTINYIGA
jgi:hypothetical protein